MYTASEDGAHSSTASSTGQLHVYLEGIPALRGARQCKRAKAWGHVRITAH